MDQNGAQNSLSIIVLMAIGFLGLVRLVVGGGRSVFAYVIAAAAVLGAYVFILIAVTAVGWLVARIIKIIQTRK